MSTNNHEEKSEDIEFDDAGIMTHVSESPSKATDVLISTLLIAFLPNARLIYGDATMTTT